MNVKDTVRDCLYNYPRIFKNKWDIYHHLFAVNGNGYEWVNGQLVDDYYEDEDDEDKEYIPQESTVPDDWDSNGRENDFTPAKDKIYPLCQYAKMLDIPDDIQPDWKEAVKEFYDSLMAHPELTGQKDKLWLKTTEP